MKTILKIMTVAIFMFTATVGMAKKPKFDLAVDKDAKSLVFKLESQFEATKIKFFDADDHMIYTENISEGVYAKKFDLKGLEDGRYFFVMENSLRALTYTVNIEGSLIRLGDRKEITKPYFRNEDGRVYLNILNLKGTDVEVKVLDSDDRLLFKQIFKGERIIEKAFNFQKAFVDTYTVVVRDSNDTYYETIHVER